MPDIEEATVVHSGGLPPADFSESISRTAEVSGYDIEIPDDLHERFSAATTDLLLPPGILEETVAALSCGHLVLQGPPGTGKSTLARSLCMAFHAEPVLVTAHEDWSVFDVIGRQELRAGEGGAEDIIPVNGFFTEAAIRCAGAIVRHFDDPEQPQAVWLVIDELNRAHADRAFGELFTVLGSREPVPITLSHQRPGNRELTTPKRFRIIATVNSYDRQFVNSLSQGLRRRFTFVGVGVPPKRDEGEAWESTAESPSQAIREFGLVIQAAQRRILARDPGQPEDRTMDSSVPSPTVISQVARLFELVERVRYASAEDQDPYLPIGTAQLIDTVELFLSRLKHAPNGDDNIARLMDWAASVKLAPLFDSEMVDALRLKRLAESLDSPFDHATRSVLRALAAEGLHYVD